MRNLFSFTPYVKNWEMKYNGMHKKKAIEGKELFITSYDPKNLEMTTDMSIFDNMVSKSPNLSLYYSSSENKRNAI
jgi:hypothetical protein